MKHIVVLLMFLATNCQSHKLVESDFKGCLQLKDFSYMDFTEFTETPTTREVDYGESSITLTVEEGYRIRYSYDGLKFIDLKVEYPMEGRFDAEKEKLTEYYEYLEKVEGDAMTVSSENNFHGYQGFVLDRNTTSTEHMFLSVNCLFDTDNSRFIYVYYWNVNREKMTFQTIDSFLSLKNTSLQEILKCLK